MTKTDEVLNEAEAEALEHENSAEEQSLIAFLFDGSGQTLFVDRSMGEVVDETNFFSEPAAGKNGIVGSQITEEDFVGEDFVAFMALKSAISLATNKGTSVPMRNLAAQWIFVQGEENEDGLSFDLCCNALGARPNLLRVRTQFEFYYKSIQFDRPLPFQATSIPGVFQLEAEAYAGEAGQRAAEYIWYYPGLRADKLVELMEEPAAVIREVTNNLEDAGLVSIQGGHWYFTGRNPLTMKSGSQFHWSRIRGL